MRNILAFIMIFLLSGCADWMNVVEGRASETNDAILRTAEDSICRYVSVGAILRNYGSSIEDAKAWVQLCLTAQDNGTFLVDALSDSGAFPTD